MSGALAPSRDAGNLVAAARGAGDGGRSGGRAASGASPLSIPAWVFYAKDTVFEICEALSEAEALLSADGHARAASRMASAFELVEAGLT